MIDVNTKLVGLLGKPLEHSFSPEMHNSTFESMYLNYYYFPIEVGKDKLPKVLEGIRNMNFAGFNVTKPNKVRVLDYLDDIEELAEKIGAVNTVVNIDGKLIGYNTDGKGFIRSFKDKIDSGPEGKKYVILGSGGAGRSIAFNLANEGAEKIVLFDQYLYCSRKVADQLNKRVKKVFNRNNFSFENELETYIRSYGTGIMKGKLPKLDEYKGIGQTTQRNLIIKIDDLIEEYKKMKEG